MKRNVKLRLNKGDYRINAGCYEPFCGMWIPNHHSLIMDFILDLLECTDSSDLVDLFNKYSILTLQVSHLLSKQSILALQHINLISEIIPFSSNSIGFVLVQLYTSLPLCF